MARRARAARHRGAPLAARRGARRARAADRGVPRTATRSARRARRARRLRRCRPRRTRAAADPADARPAGSGRFATTTLRRGEPTRTPPLAGHLDRLRGGTRRAAGAQSGATRVARRRAQPRMHGRRRAAAQLPLPDGAAPRRPAARDRGAEGTPDGDPAVAAARDPRRDPRPRRCPRLHPGALGDHARAGAHGPGRPAAPGPEGLLRVDQRRAGLRDPPRRGLRRRGRARPHRPLHEHGAGACQAGSDGDARSTTAPRGAVLVWSPARDPPPPAGRPDLTGAGEPRGVPARPSPQRPRGSERYPLLPLRR